MQTCSDGLNWAKLAYTTHAEKANVFWQSTFWGTKLTIISAKAKTGLYKIYLPFKHTHTHTKTQGHVDGIFLCVECQKVTKGIYVLVFQRHLDQYKIFDFSKII